MLTLITLAVKAGFLACGVAAIAIASVVARFAAANEAAPDRPAPAGTTGPSALELQPATEAVQPSWTAFTRGL